MDSKDNKARELILQKQKLICDKLLVNEILQSLIDKKVVVSQDATVIRRKLATAGQRAANFELLSLISNEDENWFFHFMQSLIQTKQEEIAKDIDENYFEKCRQVECDERLENNDTFKKALQGSQMKFVADLNPDRFLDQALQCGLVDNVQYRDIFDKSDTSSKTRGILNHIRTRGFKGYKIFKECLLLSDQDTVLKALKRKETSLLSEEYKSVKNKCVKSDQSPCGSRGSDSSQQSESTVTKSLKVYHMSSDLLSYWNIQKNKLYYFNLVAAERNRSFHIRVYKEEYFQTIEVGRSYTFHEVIQKSDSELWVTGQSKVGASEDEVEVDENLDIPMLPDDPPQRDLEDALKLPVQEMSTICGKIVKISQVSQRKAGTVDIRFVLLKDQQHAVAKLCLFGELAKQNLQTGEMLKVTAVRKDKYKNRQLNCTYLSHFEKDLLDDPNISITRKDSLDYIDDHDFCEVQKSPWMTIRLTEFKEIKIYNCCAAPACRKKKLVNGSCPYCNVKQMNQTDFKAYFKYATPDNSGKTISVFRSNLEEVLGDNIRCNTRDDISEFLVGKLPIKCKMFKCSQCLQCILNQA